MRRLKHAILWGLSGAVFGVGFAATASVLHMGPELWQGIAETWWWFASLGAFAGWFRPEPRAHIPA